MTADQGQGVTTASRAVNLSIVGGVGAHPAYIMAGLATMEFEIIPIVSHACLVDASCVQIVSCPHSLLRPEEVAQENVDLFRYRKTLKNSHSQPYEQHVDFLAQRFSCPPGLIGMFHFARLLPKKFLE